MDRVTRFDIATLLLCVASLLASIPPSATKAQEGTGYAARIVTGSCAAPGQDLIALSGLGAPLPISGTPAADAEHLGAADAISLVASTTILEGASITALTDEPHAIVIHAGDKSPDQMIACGAVGGILSRQMAGMIMPGDVLNVGLGGVNDSDVSGIATLQSVAGGNLQVTILLIEASGDKRGDSPTPPGTPVS